MSCTSCVTQSNELYKLCHTIWWVVQVVSHNPMSCTSCVTQSNELYKLCHTIWWVVQVVSHNPMNCKNYMNFCCCYTNLLELKLFKENIYQSVGRIYYLIIFWILFCLFFFFRFSIVEGWLYRYSYGFHYSICCLQNKTDITRKVSEQVLWAPIYLYELRCILLNKMDWMVYSFDMLKWYY